MESISITVTYDRESNKHKETLSVHDNKDKENTSETSKNKEQARDGYICMYECGKHFFHLTYERVCTEMDTKTRKTKEIAEI